MAQDPGDDGDNTISPTEWEEMEEEPVPEWMDFPEFPNVYTAWNTPGVCDRRLSRAARRALRNHLLHTVFRHVDDTERDEWQVINQEDTLYDLLERWLATVPFHRRNASCSLLPSRDVYRNDEERSRQVYLSSLPGGPGKILKIAYPSYVLKERRHGSSTSHPKQPEQWYQCGYCGKTFSTQFYLDVHMNKHHPQHVGDNVQETTDKQQDSICPADDWCRLVGIANCHNEALKAEPYYDRGSNGRGSDAAAHLVKHKWTKLAHSIQCDEKELQANCREIMMSCGLLDKKAGKNGEDDDDWVPPSTHEALASLFCQTLTCPRQQNLWQYLDEEAHDFLLGGPSHRRGSNNNPFVTGFQDHWKSIWAKEAHHHHGLLSWIGGIAVLGLVIWMMRLVASSSESNDVLARRTVPPGKRLLSKRGRLSSTTSNSRIKRD